MRAFLNRTRPRTPYLAIFQRHKPYAAVGPVDDGNHLPHLIDLFTVRPRPVVAAYADLLGALSGAPRTIITPEKSFEKVLDIVRITGPTVGPTNIVVVSPALAAELELQPGQCKVFRMDDTMVEDFQTSATQFAQHAQPLFVKSVRRLGKFKGNVIVLHTKDRATMSDVNDILGQLSTHFKDFKFAFITESETQIIANFTHLPFGEFVTDVAVVNFAGGYFYDVSSLFAVEGKMNETFDASTWGHAIVALCYELRTKNISKIYRSEPIPSGLLGALQPVVGLNYNQTVSDETRDVLVLFVKPRCPECSRLFSVYRRFAEAIRETGETSLLFGYVDTSENQIEGGFPVSVIPSIVLYPKRNKTDVKVLLSEPYRVLAWFTRTYTSDGSPITADLPTQADLTEATERARQSAGALGSGWTAVLEDELDTLAAAIAAGNQSHQEEATPVPAKVDL
jgi:hypothetical protein